MLVLSIKTAKLVHSDHVNYERIVLTLPDGSQGTIHFFHRAGNHLKCGFDLPNTVGITRGSVLDDIDPARLTAFANGQSKLAEACKPAAEAITRDELNAVPSGGPSA